MLPVDLETHAFDLDHANKYDEPIWSIKYNYVDTYNLKDMSPNSFYEHSYSQIYKNISGCTEYKNHRYIDGDKVNVT
jgi:hypothetical protein